MPVHQAPREQPLEGLQKVLVGDQEAVCLAIAERTGQRVSLDFRRQGSTLISEPVDRHDTAVPGWLLHHGDAQEMLLMAAANHLAADGNPLEVAWIMFETVHQPIGEQRDIGWQDLAQGLPGHHRRDDPSDSWAVDRHRLHHAIAIQHEAADGNR